MKIIKGDLFTAKSAIGHGVNCKGAMGAGIAKVFSSRYPEMYRKYRSLCMNGDLLPGDFFPWRDESGRWIYNLASQNKLGKDAHIEWIAGSLDGALRHAGEHLFDQIAIPQIGCGIGGLKWFDVKKVISEVESAHDVTVAVYVLD